MTTMGFAAVVFDLDGTLIDSAPDLHAALNSILGRYGRPGVALAEVIYMVGDGAMSLVERGFAATGEPLPADEIAAMTRQYLDIYEANSTALTKPFPGAVAALGRLRKAGVTLGICTNKPHEPTLGVLRALGLDGYFAGVVGSGPDVPSKPDAGHLLATLKSLDVAPELAVMVGDSQNDIGVARNAGVPVIAVDFGYTRVPVADLAPDDIIGHFDELEDALARLWRPRRIGA